MGREVVHFTYDTNFVVVTAIQILCEKDLYDHKDPIDIDALYKMHKDMYPKADFIICEETVRITVDCQGHAIETHFMEV